MRKPVLYKLKIILRYLGARRITVVPILASAVAVFLLIVVLSVMNGFSSFIQKKIRGTLSDIIVEYDDVRGFAGYEKIEAALSALPGVKAVSPHLSGKAVLTLYAGRTIQRAYDFPCIFIGVRPDAENEVTHLHDMLLEPGAGFEWRGPGEELPGIILGNEVLGRYLVQAGFPASLTTPTATDEDSSLKFRVTGHFKTGLYEYDRTTVYVPLEAAQKLTRLENRITSLHLRADEGVDLDRLKSAVMGTLPPHERFVVRTWMESEKVLIDAMRLERVIWVVILSALLAVAGFCILAVMSLTVLQKRRDIGILRSIGASVPGVLSTFILYGLVVGFLGSTLGFAGGLAVLNHLDPIEGFTLKYLRWTPWPRDVFYFERIPRDISWDAILSFWAGGIVVSFAASIIPAIRAARTDPITTLRTEH